jgi:DNA-binding CsgD family transcriptional regulator
MGKRLVPPADLTPREVEILQWMSEGMFRNQVAHILGLSLWTVQDHLRAIRAKLRAVNSAHAVAIAIRRGVIA